MNNKIMAVASIGGHWIQLLRIAKGLERHYDVVYCSTHDKCATMIGDHRFYRMADFSRWDAWKLPPTLLRMVWVMLKERPHAVFTTGAAPGLAALLAAKLCGIKTIWIDSAANVGHLSASGRIARRFASRVYTQWADLAMGEEVIYAGNIFG